MRGGEITRSGTDPLPPPQLDAGKVGPVDDRIRRLRA